MKPLFYEYEPEVFVPINFWNLETGRYLVSNYGNIYDNLNQRVLNRAINKKRNEYVRYWLRDNNGHSKNYRSNRLVAMAFIPRTEEDIALNRNDVNHKDGDKSNDYYRNLEWVSRSENTIHAYNTGLNQYIGEKARDAKRTNEMTHKVCQCIVEGMSNKECCLAVGLEPTVQNLDYVRNIRHGRDWKSISMLYNIDYSMRTKLVTSEEKVHEVCKLLETGLSNIEISNIVGVSKHVVSDTKNKRTYIHISDNYKF